MTIGKFAVLPLGQIEAPNYNLRSQCCPALFKELVESIRDNGILVPLLVARESYSCRLISGVRRCLAATELKLEQVPAYVLETRDARHECQLSIIETIHSEQISPIDRARALRHLVALTGKTQVEVARMLGKGESWMTGCLKLEQLGEEARVALANKEISPSIALGLARHSVDRQKVILARVRRGESTFANALDAVRCNPNQSAWKQKSITAIRGAVVAPDEGELIFEIIKGAIENASLRGAA